VTSETIISRRMWRLRARLARAIYYSPCALADAVGADGQQVFLKLENLQMTGSSRSAAR
jgi:threonine dehydratase